MCLLTFFTNFLVENWSVMDPWYIEIQTTDETTSVCCNCIILQVVYWQSFRLLTSRCGFDFHPRHLQQSLSELLTYCVLCQLSLRPSAGREMSSSSCSMCWRPSVADWSDWYICVLHCRSNCLLWWALDGHIMCHGPTVSSAHDNQLPLPRLWSAAGRNCVSSAIASTRPLTFNY